MPLYPNLQGTYGRLATLSPFTYGGVGDETTNDTTAIASALTAAASSPFSSRIAVDLGGKSWAVTHIDMGNYGKLINGAIVRHSGTDSLLEFPDQGALQTHDTALLRDVIVYSSSTASGTIGIEIGNHAALVLDDVKVQGNETGIYASGMQFCSFYSVKAYACTVGMYLEARLTSGGGNSSSFYDFQAVGCSAGVVINNLAAGTYPQHSIYFRNPSLLSNTVCALAAFGVEHLMIDGSANELNCSGAATLSYKGLTIKKSSMHLSNSHMTLADAFVSEATADPYVLAESGSTVTFTGKASGYGASGGEAVRVDSTSAVAISGDYDVAGCTGGVVAFAAGLRRANCCLTLPPYVAPTETVPNDYTAGPVPTFANITGATAEATGTDTDVGDYRSVQFAASTGSTASNRARVDVTLAGAYALVAVLLKSSVDTVVTVGFSAVAPRTVRLVAGRPVRVVWTHYQNSAGSQPFYVFPQDSAGATVKVAKVHAVSSATYGPALLAAWSAVAQGAYNSGAGVAAQTERVNVVAASGTAQTLPAPSVASLHRITLSGNCTFTFPTAAAGASFTLVLVQDATGSRTATWPGTVTWVGTNGSAPTLSTAAGKRDVCSFVYDGSNWIGTYAGGS